MHIFHGKCRDYAPSTDTASIELVHHGAIQVWLDGIPIDPAVNRAYLVHGADVMLSAPDPHRIDEAIIVGIASKVKTVGAQNSSGAYTTQTGRGAISTGSTGTGSANITFSPAFAAAPQLTVALDNLYTLVIGGLTTTGATVTASGAPANSYVYFSWEAQGH